MVTELGTALGTLGLDSIESALASRTPVMRSLSPEEWDHLQLLRAGGAYDAEFHAAWENGRAFLSAREGLRGRPPEVVEWKGSIRAPGDEVAPIDLRIDHVYLVSCKYLSKILFNVSPSHAFDDLLVGGQNRRGRGAGSDWFAEVAPSSYQRLYEIVRTALLDGDAAPEGAAPVGGRTSRRSGSGMADQHLPGLEAVADADGGGAGGAVGAEPPMLVDPRQLPPLAAELTSAHRAALGSYLRSGWPGDAKTAYEELSHEAARGSVERWRMSLGAGGGGGGGAGEAMVWRLLRMGSSPYFVLGTSATHSLRLRIATPWDWRQIFSLVHFDVFAQSGGQPRVGWTASVRTRASGQVHEISGHVEVRWSHGRFSGPPEAKGYLDTPHHLVPGYFSLA
jgi:hypothetical protein